MRLIVREEGMVPYRAGLALQRTVHAEVCGGGEHTLLLLEHPPVYTLGKRGGREFMVGGEERLRALGADVVETDRGGLVTFHGPGQLVGYPIVHLERLGISLRQYIEMLLEALAAGLASFEVAARWDMERPGIFVDGRKLGAVGVRLKEHVTYHGFAVNVTTDLSWFRHIVGCGLEGVEATSLARETGATLGLDEVGRRIAAALAARLGMET